jgi:hypothetical protein
MTKDNISHYISEFQKLKNEVSLLIDNVDTTRLNHIQHYLFFVHYPFFSFTDSIILLYENGKYHSASVILRSLFEAHINICYLQLEDTEHRLALAAKGGFDIKIKGIKDLKELIRKHPNLESQNPSNIFSKKWLDEAEAWAERERNAILKGNNLKNTAVELDLKSKAIKCDEKAVDGVERGHYQRMYSVIYRQLSPAAHLNVEGIQVFVNQDESGKYLFSEGKDSDIPVTEAIKICVALTKDLYDSGLLKGDRPEPLKNLEEILKRE